MLKQIVERAAKAIIADAVSFVLLRRRRFGTHNPIDFAPIMTFGGTGTILNSHHVHSTHHDDVFSYNQQEGYEPTAALLLCGVPEESLR
jgi:hypothetical protein